MKVKCITDEWLDLTKGRIYEAKVVDFHGHKMFSVEDDSGDGAYLYDPVFLKQSSNKLYN